MFGFNIVLAFVFLLVTFVRISRMRWCLPRLILYTCLIGTSYSALRKSSTVNPSSWPAVPISKGLKEKVSSLPDIKFISTTASSSVPEDKMVQVNMLNATEDAYGGVIVDMKEPMDTAVFTTLLRASLSKWREQGKNGVWLKLPIELSSLVDTAVKEGFWYHHAEKSYLMLVYWIPETDHTLPANASHRVGIGAFIVNKKGEVLVVQEKNGAFKGSGVWKLPTGVVEEGEDICAAAIREVKEETGIDAEFVEILAFRQSHESFFSKSDLFFVCMLRPLSFDIQKQNSEIEAAEWMPVEEYAAQPYVLEHKLFDYVAKICIAKKDNKYTGFSALPTASGHSAQKTYLYSHYQVQSSD